MTEFINREWYQNVLNWIELINCFLQVVTWNEITQATNKQNDAGIVHDYGHGEA